jgi:hypothetical protein
MVVPPRSSQQYCTSAAERDAIAGSQSQETGQATSDGESGDDSSGGDDGDETSIQNTAEETPSKPRGDTQIENRPYESLSFTLFLRPGSATAVEQRQQRIRSRFESLHTATVIDAFEVERWRKEIRVPASSSPDDQQAVELFDEFHERAEAIDARLRPFFDERPAVDNFFSPASADRILVFPVLCVSVREGKRLQGLYPCWRNSIHHSVGDCLDRLEAGDPIRNFVD